MVFSIKDTFCPSCSVMHVLRVLCFPERLSITLVWCTHSERFISLSSLLFCYQITHHFSLKSCSVALIIVAEFCTESTTAVREEQPLSGLFVGDSSMWLGFGWQHGLQEPNGILLLWEHEVYKRSKVYKRC